MHLPNDHALLHPHQEFAFSNYDTFVTSGHIRTEINGHLLYFFDGSELRVSGKPAGNDHAPQSTK
jgi:hypothetical protein